MLVRVRVRVRVVVLVLVLVRGAFVEVIVVSMCDGALTSPLKQPRVERVVSLSDNVDDGRNRRRIVRPQRLASVQDGIHRRTVAQEEPLRFVRPDDSKTNRRGRDTAQ